MPYQINKYVSTETLHVGSHSKAYMKTVSNMLEKLSKSKGNKLKKSNVVGVLNDIRSALLSGSLKLN